MSEALLTRIAALETELAQHRSRNTPAAIKQALLSNTQGFYASLNLTPEERLHLQRVNTADALGDSAPQELRMYSQLGPQMAQMSSLTATVEGLSRRLDELVVAPRKEEATRTSVKALIANKAEYPFLSAAIEKDPSLLDRKTKGRSGEAADIAKALEEEAKEFATVYGFKAAPAQSASDNAAQDTAQSQESKPAPLAGINADVPPLPKPETGPLTADADRQLQESLAHKYGFTL